MILNIDPFYMSTFLSNHPINNLDRFSLYKHEYFDIYISHNAPVDSSYWGECKLCSFISPAVHNFAVATDFLYKHIDTYCNGVE